MIDWQAEPIVHFTRGGQRRRYSGCWQSFSTAAFDMTRSYCLKGLIELAMPSSERVTARVSPESKTQFAFVNASTTA